MSSNAFHWIDPAVGYAKAASLLRPGGHLLLVWHFVTTANDALLTEQLQAALPAEHADLASLIGIPEDLEEWLEEGRAELIRSGRFSEPKWEWFDEPLSHTPASLADLLASYANDEPMDPATRENVAVRLGETLDPDLLKSMRNRIYAVTASVPQLDPPA